MILISDQKVKKKNTEKKDLNQKLNDLNSNSD
jgi:hypothetical protein